MSFPVPLPTTSLFIRLDSKWPSQTILASTSDYLVETEILIPELQRCQLFQRTHCQQSISPWTWQNQIRTMVTHYVIRLRLSFLRSWLINSAKATSHRRLGWPPTPESFADLIISTLKKVALRTWGEGGHDFTIISTEYVCGDGSHEPPASAGMKPTPNYLTKQAEGRCEHVMLSADQILGTQKNV